MFNWITEGGLTNTYPNFGEYHKRILALPKFAEYYNSDRFMTRLFNNKVAKLNN